MAYIVDDMLRELSQLGFYEFLLPWLFTFAIVYGLLHKANIFGSMNKRISGILAFVIAFFVSAFSGPSIAAYFSTLFGGTSLIIAALLSVILFAVMIREGFGGEDEKKKIGKGLWIAIILGVVVFLIAAGGDILNFRLFIGGSSTYTALLLIAILIVLVYFITSGKEENGETKSDKK